MNPSQKQANSFRSFAQSWWAIAVIAALVCLVIYQRWQYTHPAAPELVEVGDRIASVTLQTPDRRAAEIKWDAVSNSTIVYAFTPTCVWCKRNLEAMRTVAAHAPGYRFIAVSATADGLAEYVKANRIEVPVYVAGKNAAKQLGLVSTPTTVVIGSDGIVRKYWLRL